MEMYHVAVFFAINFACTFYLVSVNEVQCLCLRDNIVYLSIIYI